MSLIKSGKVKLYFSYVDGTLSLVKKMTSSTYFKLIKFNY